MSNIHPFQNLFEIFGKLPLAHAESVNREARESIKSWLSVPLNGAGHCILLRAPRAGHGKTHLLARLQYELGGTHEFIPLHAINGSRIDATTVLDNTLRRLVRSLPATGGLTVFDLVARRLFAASLQPLVNSGEVPCQDREGALNALRNRPVETFDFHHPAAVTAHWARDNFKLLGPRLALELSQHNALSPREVGFWVDAMFRFSATSIENPSRVSTLVEAVFGEPSGEIAMHERLVTLLGLISSLMRVVLVADEIEGFSSDEAAALRFASFIATLRQAVERVDVIISVNQDVWDSAFVPRLSGGLVDRLSEVVVDLEPLNREEMIAIIESRSPGAGTRILDQMETVPAYARGLIRDAGEVVKKATLAKETLQWPGAIENVEVAPLAPAFSKAPNLEPAVPVQSDQAAPVASRSEQVAAVVPDFSSPAESAQPVSSADTSSGQTQPFAPSFSTAVVEEEPVKSSDDFAKEDVTLPPSWPLPEVGTSSYELKSETDKAPEKATEATPAGEVLQGSSGEQPVFQAADIVEESERPPFSAAPAEAESKTEKSSPFIAAEPSQPEPVKEQPAFSVTSPEQAGEEAAKTGSATVEDSGEDESNVSSTDRVDDLLRQFRERYGKG